MITTKVFIACSLDGYISDKDDKIDWLHEIDNPTQDDMGYSAFIKDIDALLMGRKTFEKVLSFGITWPYNVPVYVLSSTLNEIPESLDNNVRLVSGNITDILTQISADGHEALYIDGGSAIASFLELDLIDEMTITTIPLILGGGSPLFFEQDMRLHFKCVESKTYLDAIVQSKFVRVRDVH